MLVCVSLQDNGYTRSALHMASEGGLAGTVAQLVSHGADAALKDAVRACTCMRTWSYTYSMRVYSLGAYIRLCHKNSHIHTSMYACAYTYIRTYIYTCMYVCIDMHMHTCITYTHRDIPVFHVSHTYTAGIDVHICVYIYVCMCLFL